MDVGSNGKAHQVASLFEGDVAGVNLEGVKIILRLQSEVERLDHQVKRMRRLLADAEDRLAGKGRRSRDLPDVVRPTLDQLLE